LLSAEAPDSRSWASPQLAEFLVGITEAGTTEAAIAMAVEKAAEALEAEVAAVVVDGSVVASLGFPRGEVPEAGLAAAASAHVRQFDVAGIGPCHLFTVDLHGTEPAVLLLARREAAFTSQEAQLVRAMARSLDVTLRMLEVIDRERSLRAVLEEQAVEKELLVTQLWERQALLERLARIQRSISHRAPLQEVLGTIAAGAAELFGDEVVGLRLVDPDNPTMMRLVAHAGLTPEQVDQLARRPVGEGVGGRVIEEERLVLMDNYDDAVDAIPLFAQSHLKVAMGAPVREDGRVMGSLTVASYNPSRIYSRDEQDMLLSFAEHASLALTDARTVAQMQHQAFHDHLTGLPNRSLLLDRLERVLARARVEVGAQVGVIFLDLDRFKNVNDSLGHEQGDELLGMVGRRIEGCLRAIDTAARLGGDEFAVLVDEPSGIAETQAVADRIIASLRRPFNVNGRATHISASAGVAISAMGVEDAGELLRNADLAMYQAKVAGSGRSASFEPSMHSAISQRLELEDDLQLAIDGDQFGLRYQPVHNLQTGEVRGVEALVRWFSPSRGMVLPLDFIAVAEETGLIVPIGAIVLRQALTETLSWGSSTATISVNLSARQFEQPSLVTELAELFDATGADPDRVILEITETVLMHDTTTVIARLGQLKELGVRLAVDDFGTGYSSLGYLRRFPIDILKIDRSFIEGISSGGENRAVAEAIVNLARTLGLQTVAEGIETQDQLDVLRQLGCQAGQGYLFSKPLGRRRLHELLQAQLATPA
jgi:diguanylate cyclase (GGDEF)-like protein